MLKKKHSFVLAAVAVALAGCATSTGGDPFMAMMKSSFRDQGIAKVDRLNQDAGQAACSSDQAPPEAVTKRIEAENLATVKWPTGGQYLALLSSRTGNAATSRGYG